MSSKNPIAVHAASTPLVRATRTFLWTSLAVLLVMLSSAAVSHAQFARPGELPAIDAAARAAIVDSVTAAIDSIYVLETPAKRIVEGLRKNLAGGEYDDLTDPVEFVERLYRDAQAINHDGHFRMAAMPSLDPALAEQQQDEDPADVDRRNRIRRAQNYGFEKAEILPGGIGYVKFNQFSHGDDAFAAAAAAMNFLANSNAIILDLRENGGGSAAMIRFICGYLFEEKEHLINWDIRAEKKTVQSYSADYVPGKRITEQPVYILTSDRTFSAAEEFTFDLKNLERATVVGDTTGGGGHTVSTYVFDFDSLRVGIRIPYGRAYNPENNEGWEGVGVTPDIAVPTEQALDAARADALQKLIESEEDEQITARYRWSLTDLESRLNPIELPNKQMKQYVGGYGPRKIFIEDGVLYYQREDRPRYKMEPMGEDLFRVGDLDYFRITFERNDSGKIVKLIGLYDSGRTDENERDKS
ncbi:MAG: S41 family peptidase [bacterium]